MPDDLPMGIGYRPNSQVVNRFSSVARARSTLQLASWLAGSVNAPTLRRLLPDRLGSLGIVTWPCSPPLGSVLGLGVSAAGLAAPQWSGIRCGCWVTIGHIAGGGRRQVDRRPHQRETEQQPQRGLFLVFDISFLKQALG
jgi:hypothetical protein